MSMKSHNQNNQTKILEIVEFLFSDLGHKAITEFSFDWNSKRANPDSELFGKFKEAALIEDSGENIISRQGVLLLARTIIDIDGEIKRKALLSEKYKVLKKIRSGKNSSTFLAEHKLLKKQFVLKFIRPGASETLEEAVQLISDPETPNSIVQPDDFFITPINDIAENPVELYCIVFPYLLGKTLDSYLRTRKAPLTPSFALSFIEQVGGALAYLEEKKAYHGDLHPGNILVSESPNGALSFRLLDISFGLIGSQSSELCHDNDIELFRRNILIIVNSQKSNLSRMSVRKYLGADLYFLISFITSSKEISFRKIQEKLEKNESYEDFKLESEKFIEEKFSKPAGLKLLRHEEITDPSVAVQLFEPYPTLKNSLEEFGNALITGHRGSGKSTYLASLAYFPSIEKPVIDPREIFGIFFACRQGEFRQFASAETPNLKLSALKHILVVKIIRRSLELLVEAIKRERLKSPATTSIIRKFIEEKICFDAIPFFKSTASSELSNILSSVIRCEMSYLERLSQKKDRQTEKQWANEGTLKDYFSVLQNEFPDLLRTRFYVIFDDAGAPNMPANFQSLVNDLIVSSNPIYCIKLSAEKFTYSFISASGKQLEYGHDYLEHDISRELLIGGGASSKKKNLLEKYFKSILTKRLRVFGYESHDICDYLGKDLITNKVLVDRLANSRRNAYYCGWNNIWQIADRTPRNLLEIVSEIFSASDIEKNTLPYIIPEIEQNKAIQIISEKRYRSLSLISGSIKINGQEESLGKAIQNITAAIGHAFRAYLTSSKDKERKDQLLAIERNDFSELSPAADLLLKNLISYGVLDDSRMETSRDDQIKKPIYVINRIFCPYFNIGLVRDQHLRLSKDKIETLLVNPQAFIKSGTSRLKSEMAPETKDLFGDL